MPNLAKMLKDEIVRLARKQVRVETAATRKAVAGYRREIARLKREVGTQRRKLDFLERQEKRRVATPHAPAASEASNARFSPKWLRSHRQKLGLSAADYAKLLGVSMLTVYNWEHEKARPRQSQVAKLASVRGLGVREARKRLELMRGRKKA